MKSYAATILLGMSVYCFNNVLRTRVATEVSTRRPLSAVPYILGGKSSKQKEDRKRGNMGEKERLQKKKPSDSKHISKHYASADDICTRIKPSHF